MLNTAIIKNPVNWLTVGLMSFIFIYALSLITHGVVKNG